MVEAAGSISLKMVSKGTEKYCLVPIGTESSYRKRYEKQQKQGDLGSSLGSTKMAFGQHSVLRNEVFCWVQNEVAV